MRSHFQVPKYWNKLVQPPHIVISNIGSMNYYKMNQKYIDETSVMKRGLASMINVYYGK